MKRNTLIVVALATLVVLTSCVHTELVWREFDEEPLLLDVRIAPNAQIDATYNIKLDADDPLGSIISIGTSVAKAAHVEEAQVRMDAAMQRIDLRDVLEDELGEFYTEVMEMKIVEKRRAASYRLYLEVDQYGIDADGGGTYFVLNGHATLYDEFSGTRVWRSGYSSRASIGPEVFGLPAAAGDILSAAMLSELDEDEMLRGIDRVSREAAWQVGMQFEDDLYRARQTR